ncbi:hypothetical protein Bca4012_009295 [Brassica carinata]
MVSSGEPPSVAYEGKLQPSSEISFPNSNLDSKLQSFSSQGSIPSTLVPSYAERFKSSRRNLKKIANPTFLEDGTPVVQAPTSILLKTAEIWKDHIVAHFHGTCPPPGKIFADLNPVWEKFGDIRVRMMLETSCLNFVPNVKSREWVLQVGYWQVDHCAVSVFPWSAEGSFQDLELRFAPTWVILKNVPTQLYSLDGISVVASAIGEQLHTEKLRLDPYHFGDTKVKVEIDLSVTPPHVVEVRDTQNNSVRIRIEYPKLPLKCCNCGKFGHLMNRCPRPFVKRKLQTQVQEKEKIKVALAPSAMSVSRSGASVEPVVMEVKKESELPKEKSAEASSNTKRRARSRSRARARHRSLSQLPSYRFHSPCSEGEEAMVSEITVGLVSTSLEEVRVRDLGKKVVNNCGLGGEAEKCTYSDTSAEEHICLLPRAARRAQKHRDRLA